MVTATVPRPPSRLPSGNGSQVETIREGRQNIRIWVASMLTGVRQISGQNGGSVRDCCDQGS
jgi:hypothetical protein